MISLANNISNNIGINNMNKGIVCDAKPQLCKKFIHYTKREAICI